MAKTDPPKPSFASIPGLARLALENAERAKAKGLFAQAVEWVTTSAAKGAGTLAIELEAELRYRLGGELAAERKFGEAEAQLSVAARTGNKYSRLAQERLRLVRKRTTVEQDLETLRERFGESCAKCNGRDLYAIATCSHQLSPVPRAIKLPANYLAPGVTEVYAAAAYRSGWDPDRKDPLSILLRSAKRTIDPVAVRAIGLLLADYVAYHTHLISIVDVVVPIPTSREREENRGGGIPHRLALALRDALKLPFRESVVQVQSHLDHTDAAKPERRKSLKTAWRVKTDSLLSGSSVLLVDDILTTGTTMSVGAELLRSSGVKEVFGLVLMHTERA
jgi:predicted amidophosphoribosyltransferase